MVSYRRNLEYRIDSKYSEVMKAETQYRITSTENSSDNDISWEYEDSFQISEVSLKNFNHSTAT